MHQIFVGKLWFFLLLFFIEFDKLSFFLIVIDCWNCNADKNSQQNSKTINPGNFPIFGFCSAGGENNGDYSRNKEDSKSEIFESFPNQMANPRWLFLFLFIVVPLILFSLMIHFTCSRRNATVLRKHFEQFWCMDEPPYNLHYKNFDCNHYVDITDCVNQKRKAYIATVIFYNEEALITIKNLSTLPEFDVTSL